MNKSIKIECPLCKKITELMDLEELNADEDTLKKVNELKDAGKLVYPQMSKPFYTMICGILGNDRSSGIGLSISKIKSHKVNLFGKSCTMSNKVFKVFFIYVLNHTTKSAGVTFHLDEEIKNE